MESLGFCKETLCIMSIFLKLITPEKTLFDEVVDSLTCSTTLGQITVLPNHLPFVAELVADELIVRQGKDEHILHAGGGFIQVFPGSKVVILADAAERVTEIDVARAEEAAVRAKDVLEKSQMSDREYAATSALLDRNLARLKIVRKHAHRRSSPITSEGVLEE